jgi:glycosyltransferase involved in cell wall biosynthesis
VEEKSKLPIFSIVMPSYNAHATVEESVASVVAQNLQEWELLICDDSSADDTLATIQTLQDSRIRILRNNCNMGTAYARNRCLSHAKGRYIAFLDADDVWDPGVLQAHLVAHKRYHPGLTYSDYYVMDATGQVQGFFKPSLNITLRSLLRSCDIGLLTACIDRQIVGDFRFPHSPKEDYALWLVLCAMTNVHPRKVDSPGCFYRLSNHSSSSNKWSEIKRQWYVIRYYGHCSLPKALTNIACYICKGLLKHFFQYRTLNNLDAVTKEK